MTLPDDQSRAWIRFASSPEFERDLSELMLRMRPDWTMELKDGTVLRARLTEDEIAFDSPFSGCRTSFNRTNAVADRLRVARCMALDVLHDRFLRDRAAR